MDDSLVYRKTSAGAAQLQATHGVLAPAARRVLILLDGQRTVAELGELFGLEAVQSLIPKLEAMGLARRVEAEHPPTTMEVPADMRPRPPEAEQATGAARPGRAWAWLVVAGVLAFGAYWVVNRPHPEVLAGGSRILPSEASAAPAPAPVEGRPSASAPPEAIGQIKVRAPTTAPAPAPISPRAATRPSAPAPSAVKPAPTAAPAATPATPATVALAPTSPAPPAVPVLKTAPPAAGPPVLKTAPPAPSPPALKTAPPTESPPAPAPAAAPPSPAPVAAAARSDAIATAPVPAASPSSPAPVVTVDAAKDDGAGALALAGRPAGREAAPLALRPRAHVPPQFPGRALRTGVTEGSVQAHLLISADGTVEQVDIVRATPPHVFDDEVRRALSLWTYEPPGRQVQTTVQVTFKP